VLVAPVLEKGAVQRDIYLPDGGFQWQDSRSEQVFDGGTHLAKLHLEAPVRPCSFGAVRQVQLVADLQGSSTPTTELPLSIYTPDLIT
ncbi:hypothetical protein GOODEAATRI_003174, partial [Goodea atripinnis]